MTSNNNTGCISSLHWQLMIAYTFLFGLQKPVQSCEPLLIVSGHAQNGLGKGCIPSYTIRLYP